MRNRISECIQKSVDNFNAILTDENYEYIPRIKWTNNPKVLALYGMNRHQNKLDLNDQFRYMFLHT